MIRAKEFVLPEPIQGVVSDLGGVLIDEGLTPMAALCGASDFAQRVLKRFSHNGFAILTSQCAESAEFCVNQVLELGLDESQILSSVPKSANPWGPEGAAESVSKHPSTLVGIDDTVPAALSYLLAGYPWAILVSRKSVQELGDEIETEIDKLQGDCAFAHALDDTIHQRIIVIPTIAVLRTE